MEGTVLQNMHESSERSLLRQEKTQVSNSFQDVRPEPPIHTATKGLDFSVPDSWLLESLSMVASILCQGAIVGILVSMHNKPLDDWAAPVSLNAAIAILTTASKSLLLLPVTECISQSKWAYFERPRRMLDFDVFDNASRGPLGSFRFLLRRQTIATLASIGAVITLLALAVDPFAQQVISFQQRAVPIGMNTASFGYNNVYDNGGSADAFGGIPNLFKQDTIMQGAVMNGLYGLNLTTTFDCKSSNCTWPGTYTTLGFESTCKNVTTQVSRKCNNDNEGIGSSTTASQTCNITTPGNVTLQSQYVPTELRTAINISTAVSTDRCLPMYNPNCGTAGSSSNVITFAAYRYFKGNNVNDTFDNIHPWEVIECSISAVAYKYSNVSVQNNQFKVGHIQTIPLLRITNTSYDNDTLNASPMFLATVNASQSFSLNYNDWKNLLTFLSTKVFTGSIVGINPATTNDKGLAPSALYNANITEIMNNIALSMTNRVRTGRNSTLAQGIALRQESFVVVRWPWLALPIFTVLAAGVFLLMTALQTQRRRRYLWKSSSVALLSHRIVGWDEQAGDSVRSQAQLERVATEVKLKLYEEEHLRLVKI